MKDRLTAIGLRSISPLVDITNYINYDMARPLHAFDADKLKGNVTVRMAKDGEKFVSLEDKEYALDCKSLGICDDEGVQCLGGIMGGAAKGCSEETKDVFWNVLCLSLSALPVPAAAFRLIQTPAIVMNAGLIRNPIFWGRTMPHS